MSPHRLDPDTPMRQPGPRPTVIALINSTPDVIEMLRVAFEYAGFVVVSTYTFLIRQGEINIEAFIQQHQPEVIVYDIAPPYTSNWHLFEHISQLPALKGRPFVLTSTNPARVRELAKTDEAIFEIVETPYQIMQLVDIVKRAARHLPATRSE
jgi:CheY-like chemotaxis protein